MSESDTEYYLRRANEEREMTLKSARQDVAVIHEELARQYQALAAEKRLRPTLSLFSRQRASS